MKQQNNQCWQTILMATIAMIFLLGVFSSTFAQKGSGAKYGARDPQQCAQTKAAGNKPTVAEAVAAVICNSEHEFGGNLYLVEDVKVTSFGKGQRPNPNNRLYSSTPDLDSLEYEIRGSLKKYQCSRTSNPNERERSCNVDDAANAKGVCYKDTFGSWVCSLVDLSVTDSTKAVPPGGKTAANNAPAKDKPAAKNGDKTTDKPVETDENGFPKPDFSEIEKYFEIVRYEYDFSGNRFPLLVKAIKKTNIFEWYLTFYDADGVKVKEQSLNGSISSPELGEPTKIYGYTPSEKEMKEVKRITITRKPN